MNKLPLSKSDKIKNLELATGDEISYEAFQSIYNELTGKKENLIYFYDEPYIFDVNNICQLDFKINQLIKSFDPLEINSNIVVSHVNDGKVILSDFVKFKQYDVSNNSPIESINIEYNFALLDKTLHRPKTYKIEVTLVSKCAIRQEMIEKMGKQALWIKLSNMYAGKVVIEHVDYVIAKNIHYAIDDWFKGLLFEKKNKVVLILQNFSHNFSFFSGLLAVFISSIVFYSFIYKLEYDGNVEWLIKVVCVFFFVFYTLSVSSRWLGARSESYIDLIQKISIIKINNADCKLDEANKRLNSSGFKKFLGLSAVNIIINLFSGFFLFWLTK